MVTTLLKGVERVAIATCCPAGLSEPLERDAAVLVAQTLKAIADPARLQLIALIRSKENCEACVCDLVEPLELSQSTISHHLKVLVDAGILRKEKRGYWTWYSVAPESLSELAAILV